MFQILLHGLRSSVNWRGYLTLQWPDFVEKAECKNICPSSSVLGLLIIYMCPYKKIQPCIYILQLTLVSTPTVISGIIPNISSHILNDKNRRRASSGMFKNIFTRNLAHKSHSYLLNAPNLYFYLMAPVHNHGTYYVLFTVSGFLGICYGMSINLHQLSSILGPIQYVLVENY